MEKEKAIKKLSERWPNAEALRKEFSGLSALLSGEFARDSGEDKFMVYGIPYTSDGLVVSRPLNQGLIKNPTVGLIAPGQYHFDTGENIETMTVLEGELYAKVNGDTGSIFSMLVKYGSIMAPAGTELKLEVQQNSPVFYLCQYKPKK